MEEEEEEENRSAPLGNEVNAFSITHTQTLSLTGSKKMYTHTHISLEKRP